jgi:hypothetical protein
MCRRRYSHVDGRRLLAGLGSAASSELRGRAACPHPAVDRGTSATARRGNGVAATGLETAATAQGRCRRSPSGSGAATAQGRCRRSPSGSGAATAGLGTAAIACRGRGAAATAARTIGQPPSLMNQDGA